jgi:hypothetical protein
LLSLIHVVERRAVVTGDQVALSDHLGGELTYADLAARPYWAGRDRQVS